MFNRIPASTIDRVKHRRLVSRSDERIVTHTWTWTLLQQSAPYCCRASHRCIQSYCSHLVYWPPSTSGGILAALPQTHVQECRTSIRTMEPPMSPPAPSSERIFSAAEQVFGITELAEEILVPGELSTALTLSRVNRSLYDVMKSPQLQRKLFYDPDFDIWNFALLQECDCHDQAKRRDKHYCEHRDSPDNYIRGLPDIIVDTSPEQVVYEVVFTSKQEAQAVLLAGRAVWLIVLPRARWRESISHCQAQGNLLEFKFFKFSFGPLETLVCTETPSTPPPSPLRRPGLQHATAPHPTCIPPRDTGIGRLLAGVGACSPLSSPILDPSPRRRL